MKIEVIGWRVAVEMRLEVFRPATADLGDALAWAQRHLEALPTA